MTKASMRAGILACAIASTSPLPFLATPAQAQAQYVAAPNLPEQDANGVDLRRGTFAASWEDLSVGAGAFPQRLALVRSYNSDAAYIGAFGSNASHNFDMRAYRRTSGSTVTVEIVIGPQTEEFTQVSAGVYSSTEAGGATLSGTFSGSAETLTYTMKDGSRITFSPTDSQNCDSSGVQCGRATQWTFPSGAQLSFGYTTFLYTSGTFPNIVSRTVQALSSVTSNFGYRLSFTSQKNSRLTMPVVTNVTASNLAQSPATVASIAYAYDSVDPKLATVTDTQSHVTTLGYSGYSLTSITPPSAPSAARTIGYGTSGLVSTVAVTGVGTWTYAFTATQTIVTDPGSNVTTLYFGSDPLPQWTKDGLNRQTSYTYDGNHRLLTQTLPEGNSVQLVYDSRGNVTQTTAHAKPGSGLPDVTSSAAYPSTCTNLATCNLPTSTTDARGNAADYTYDATTGQVLTVTLPAPTGGAVRPQARYGYSALQAWYDTGSGIAASGLPVSMPVSISACQTGSSCTGTSDEVKTSIAYPSGGTGNNLNPASVTSGSGDGALAATSAFTWDAAGNLLTVDGPLAGSADTTRYRWDSERRRIGIVSPDPDGAGAMKMRALRETYDARGRLTSVDRGTVASQSDADWSAMTALETRSVAYDSGSRKSQETLSAGGTTYSLTQTSYDSVGRVQCVAQRMNPAAYGSLPADACTLGTAGSYGNDRIVRTSYDAANEATKTTSAYGTAEQADDVTTAYTANGKVESVTDAEGNKTSYVHDGFDRVSQTLYPSATKGSGTSNAGDYEQFGYDANGNVTSFRNRANETASFSYDALNRLTYKDLPGTEPDVGYTFDLLNRLTSAATSAQTLSFTYDALGRSLTQAGPQGTLTSTWDTGGRRTRITHPDGFYVDQDFLVTGELQTIRENGATSGVGVLATYSYDDLGRRRSLTLGDGSSTTYGYDAVSRLTSLGHDLAGTTYDQTLGFSYDPAGGITQNTRSNDAYAWTGHYNVNRSYTANGLNQYTASGSVTPTYDTKGNLISAGGATYAYSSENLLTSATGGITLAYDPAMRLYQIAGGTPGTTRFAYDGSDLVAEYDGTNVLQRRYVHGPGTDEPLVWYEGSGTTDRRFLHSDERGSVVSVGSSAGTSVNTYDEYGIPRSTNTGRFQYTGQTWLPELGMYYYKARIYSPTLGRFLQTDPIGYDDGLNWYNYVGSDPLSSTDPNGEVNCPINSHPVKIPGGGSSGGNNGTTIEVRMFQCVADRAPVFNNGTGTGSGSSSRIAGGTRPPCAVGVSCIPLITLPVAPPCPPSPQSPCALQRYYKSHKPQRDPCAGFNWADFLTDLGKGALVGLGKTIREAEWSALIGAGVGTAAEPGAGTVAGAAAGARIGAAKGVVNVGVSASFSAAINIVKQCSKSGG
jgi:RHS repeat-associated protein